LGEILRVKKLTAETRAILRRPLGKVVSGRRAVSLLKGKRNVVSVGDFCSGALLGGGVRPAVVIYDHRCLREPIGGALAARLDAYDGKALRVANPPGFITDELVTAVRKVLKRGRGKILVIGEEDLAALVVLIHALDGTPVVYGQPKRGMVLLEANGELRAKARAIFGKMKRAGAPSA
jgi:uncharacterized protein (UPF0218 family)